MTKLDILPRPFRFRYLPGAVGSHHITLAGSPEVFLVSLTLSSSLYFELIF
jgi:hypothetical protein